MVAFIPGLRLSELFYREAVRPILGRAFRGLPHAAALLGSGSDVLGFDSERSTDHEWGPRLLLFLAEEDAATRGPEVVEALRHALPHRFRGYPTNFGATGEEGIRRLAATESGPVEHRVLVTSVPGFLGDRLGTADWRGMGAVGWLLCPEQRLLEVTAGAVFHDGPGELGAARAALASYPRDVWLHRLAAQWQRVAQQEAFVGRCAEVGDGVGSALVAADLVRDLMRLGFLMGRRYAPYSKWLGTAFARLACAPALAPHLAGVLGAGTHEERERHLAAAYTAAAELHNSLGVTAALDTSTRPYFDRPFRVIDAGRFAEAIRARIEDDGVRRLPVGVGGVDQWVDAVDVLTDPTRLARLRALYEGD